jgi:hypothetical protein
MCRTKKKVGRMSRSRGNHRSFVAMEKRFVLVRKVVVLVCFIYTNIKGERGGRSNKSKPSDYYLMIQMITGISAKTARTNNR